MLPPMRKPNFLPERSGADAAATAVDAERTLSLLRATEFSATGAVDESGCAFLQKPFTGDALAEKVRELLSEAAARG